LLATFKEDLWPPIFVSVSYTSKKLQVPNLSLQSTRYQVRC
jgi:hypothetical protein